MHMNVSDYLIKLVLFLLVGFQLSGKKIDKVQNFPILERGPTSFYKLCNIQKSPEGESKFERVNWYYSATLVHKTDKNQHDYVDVFVTSVA